METPRFHLPLLEETDLEVFLNSSEKHKGMPLMHTGIAVDHCHAIVHALICSTDDSDLRICMNKRHIYHCLHLLDEKLESISKAINKGMEVSYHV